MTYVCFTWENEADAQLLKLQRLQNRAHRVVENFDRSANCTWLSKFLRCMTTQLN
jgi:hypothetical protein